MSKNVRAESQTLSRFLLKNIDRRAASDSAGAGEISEGMDLPFIEVPEYSNIPAKKTERAGHFAAVKN